MFSKYSFREAKARLHKVLQCYVANFAAPVFRKQFSKKKKQLLLKWASEVASKIERMSEVPHQLPSSEHSESFIEFAAELLITDDSDRQINMYRLM